MENGQGVSTRQKKNLHPGWSHEVPGKRREYAIQNTALTFGSVTDKAVYGCSGSDWWKTAILNTYMVPFSKGLTIL